MMQDISTMVAEKIAQQKEELIFSKLMEVREKAMKNSNQDLWYFMDDILNIWTNAKYKGISTILEEMNNIMASSNYEIILVDEPQTFSASNIDSEMTDSKLKFTFTHDLSNFKIIIKEKLMEV